MKRVVLFVVLGIIAIWGWYVGSNIPTVIRSFDVSTEAATYHELQPMRNGIIFEADPSGFADKKAVELMLRYESPTCQKQMPSRKIHLFESSPRYSYNLERPGECNWTLRITSEDPIVVHQRYTNGYLPVGQALHQWFMGVLMSLALVVTVLLLGDSLKLAPKEQQWSSI